MRLAVRWVESTVLLTQACMSFTVSVRQRISDWLNCASQTISQTSPSVRFAVRCAESMRSLAHFWMPFTVRSQFRVASLWAVAGAAADRRIAAATAAMVLVGAEPYVAKSWPVGRRPRPPRS